MITRLELKIALRYFRSRKKEKFISIITWFSLIGIALGVGTLIIVMSVMNGFHDQLLKKILGINGNIKIRSTNSQFISSWEQYVSPIQKIDGIQRAIPILENQAMITSGRISSGVIIKGIRANDLQTIDILKKSLSPQALKQFSQQQGIIIGEGLAQKLSLQKDKSITLISPNGKYTPFGMMPKIKVFQVIGTFSSGMYIYDNSYAFMPQQLAYKYFSANNQITSIEVYLKDNQQSDAIARLLDTQLQKAHLYTIQWSHVNQEFFNAIKVERNVMFLILSLIIIVASFNIISALTILVKDKSADIAILQTLGMTQLSIVRIFLLIGLLIGLIGTLCGTILGTIIAENIDNIRQVLENYFNTELFSAEIYFLSNLPSKVEYNEVITIALLTLSLSFLATLYPAIKASRIPPVETLKYE